MAKIIGNSESTLASLDTFFGELEEPMVNQIQTLSEKIRQRRTQMLVHSYLYYVMDENVISDEKWQQWADELTSLQSTWNALGMTKEIGFYDKEFADWNGSTGMHLPQENWIVDRAKLLLKNH
jgi:hypothetical protein